MHAITERAEVSCDRPGHALQRCRCTNPSTGREFGRSCPQLSTRGHGSWYFDCATADLRGRPLRNRRGGYPTRTAACAARDETLGRSREDHTAHTWTLAQWLPYCAAGRRAGLRWSEVDLDHGELAIVRQRTSAGPGIVEGPPKSAASRGTVALDRQTVAVLRAHQRRQQARPEAWVAAGKVWHDTGYVFTGPDGSPLHPAYLTHRFTELVIASGLPPVRLHDLRHGAAALALTAGVDLKVIQDQVGHATIVTTADTYTSVLPVTPRRAAEATAKVVLKAARQHRETVQRSAVAAARKRDQGFPAT
ncbi:hypothetical protein Val02_92160 [Virgisporangium aliadipatigenens]|uniref:Tyr recombinase domain-containing protein n=1 Tax=Virgisporangium aliadipatigenens TaxID=741659 RepID=A0A8J4DVE7_9ACTN|nr:tyrosine-type recombinase/integrase [Virgisporangium aliadipatigenens]GIJ52330.1 hypothetical protein Val02_92160 [Virgisporangium aliadipatigenens]